MSYFLYVSIGIRNVFRCIYAYNIYYAMPIPALHVGRILVTRTLVRVSLANGLLHPITDTQGLNQDLV
jgi:hypothetical protein